MSIFCIPDYEGFLHTMIDTYDRFSRTNSFSYLGRDLVISYKAADFTRVFGIPEHAQGGKKIDGNPMKLRRGKDVLDRPSVRYII